MRVDDPRQARVQLEERLATLPLTFSPRRASRWELARFPTMAAIYGKLARNHIVSEQNLFARTVAALMDQVDNPAAMLAPCAYPALVRQHHYFLVFKEHFPIAVVLPVVRPG